MDGIEFLLALFLLAMMITILLILQPWSAISSIVLMVALIVHKAFKVFGKDRELDRKLRQEAERRRKMVAEQMRLARRALETNFDKTVAQMRAIIADQRSDPTAKRDDSAKR